MISKAGLLKYAKENNIKTTITKDGNFSFVYLYDENFCTEEWWVFEKTKMISLYVFYLGTPTMLNRQ